MFNISLTTNDLLFPICFGKKAEHKLILISIWGKIIQKSDGKFRRKAMDFCYLTMLLLLEIDKCFINQLWPFSYISRTSGHLAGDLLEKLLLLPSDRTISGWYLLYLLVQADSGMPGTYMTSSIWTAWFICAMQIICIVDCVLQTGSLVCRSTPHCMQYNFSLTSNKSNISWTHWIHCVYTGEICFYLGNLREMWELLLFIFRRIVGMFSCLFLVP